MSYHILTTLFFSYWYHYNAKVVHHTPIYNIHNIEDMKNFYISYYMPHNFSHPFTFFPFLHYIILWYYTRYMGLYNYKVYILSRQSNVYICLPRQLSFYDFSGTATILFLLLLLYYIRFTMICMCNYFCKQARNKHKKNVSTISTPFNSCACSYE